MKVMDKTRTPFPSEIEVAETRIGREEEKLPGNEEFSYGLIEDLPNPVFIINTDTSIRYVNPALENLTGFTTAEVIGRKMPYPWWITGRSTGSTDTPVKTVSDRVHNLELYRKKDGEIFWVEVTIVPVIHNGEVQYFISSWIDVTRARKVEKQLIEINNYYKTILDGIMHGVLVTDKYDVIRYSNEVMTEITGISPDKLYGKSIITDSLENRIACTCNHYLKAKKTLKPLYFNEVPSTAPGGGKKYQSFCLIPIVTAGIYNGMIITIEDITESKRLEEEEQRIAKLESIGTLAAGIAHDFNNLLTGIMGNISLAMRHVEPKGKALERLEEAEKASEKAKSLTQQLLIFSRGGAPIKRIVDMGKITEEAATFALRGSKVKPVFSLSDDLWALEADEGQINQVISNIVINADQAMPQGGTINIEATNLTISARKTLPLPAGNYVRIAIKDTGIGIPKKHHDNIFDPFFTTKQKGSGLGLTTAFSIAKNHGGYITFESEIDSGTTFHVYLPASEESVPAEEAVMETQIRGTGRILVMDDEEVIRDMLSKMLPVAGYQVELTNDGAKAIAKYTEAKNSGKPFDAVIMDLTIPGGMGGKEAIKKLLEVDHDVRVIVSSGYSTDPIMSEYKEYGFSAVITKPYSVSQMEKTLRGILKGKK